MAEEKRSNPAPAAAFLTTALARGDRREFLIALRKIVDAFGGIPWLAEETGLNEKTLYRTLSPKGNPSIKSLLAIASAMGMKLAVQPVGGSARREER